MTKLEKELEAAVVRRIKAIGGLCLKWTSPSANGVPDRIILLPGGIIAFAELKRPKGYQIGPLQKHWAERLKRLGFKHYFIHTESDLNQMLWELAGVRPC